MPRKTLTFGIADDMLLDQTLIASSIKRVKNSQLLFCAGNGEELLFKLKHNQPQILIIDLNMPFMDGWETLKVLRSSGYKASIICTSSSRENNLKEQLLELGVQGFVRKQEETLYSAINAIINGKHYFDTLSTHNTNNQLNNVVEEVEIDGREIAIINHLAQGFDSKSIAEKVQGISSKTVDTYIKHLLHKFQLKNRAHLVSMGYSYGLIHKFDGFYHLPKPKPKPKPKPTETGIEN